MNRERLGLMGGSFNPFHSRHLGMALAAKKEYKLDKLLFVPSGNPPHKREGLESAEDRFEMTWLATCQTEGAEASRVEVDREGVIYAVDTLRILHEQYPRAEIFYIIGEDTMEDLPNWRDPDTVFTLCRFLVCPRETVEAEKLPCVKALRKRGAKLSFLKEKPMEVSSTAVREALRQGQTPSELPPQVMAYIRVAGLYGLTPSPLNGRALYEQIKPLLSTKRLLHSLMVCEMARELAQLHGVDEEKATTAALLHDCAKCLPLSEMKKLVLEDGQKPDEETLSNGGLLHGPAGAVLARDRLGVTDPEILQAIDCHTTGRAGMTKLDMIVYLADKIERSRKPYPMLEKLRALSQQDLRRAVMASLQSTVEFVRGKGDKPLHPQTLKSYEWLQAELEKEENQP